MVIQRVVEQVMTLTPDVYVATDDPRIMEAVSSFGGKTIMTSTNHQSGTDRIREALDILCGISSPHHGQTILSLSPDMIPDVIINVQGDEPFIQRSQLETVMRCFDDSSTQIATLGKRFESIEAVMNPNSPKIVVDNNNYAMYFSRSPIPFIRGKEQVQWLSSYPFLKHLGLYAYRTDVLRAITNLPQSSLEQAESLEQLRWLQNGYRIKVGLTDVETVGIDTPEDLKHAEDILQMSR